MNGPHGFAAGVPADHDPPATLLHVAGDGDPQHRPAGIQNDLLDKIGGHAGLRFLRIVVAKVHLRMARRVMQRHKRLPRRQTPRAHVLLDDLENPSFAAIARAMGAEGHVITQLSDVGPALRAACAAQTEGKTTILEMTVTRELGDPFRRDALSMPVRRLEKYKAYV